MKLFVLSMISCLPVLGQNGIVQVPPKQPVPVEVMASAQQATQALMNKVVRGDFKALVDKEYPAWSKVAARTHPSVAAYKAHVIKTLKDAVANGFNFQAALAQQPMVGHEVDFKGKEYKAWMVFVPTVNDFSMMDRAVQPPALRKLRARRFQIAIASKADLTAKGGEAWTFISGAGIKGLQLRQIFPFLPKDEKQLGFPPVGMDERRGNLAPADARKRGR